MENAYMMGDFEEGDDLVDLESFVNHRGGGEEPFYVPDDNDSDESQDENDVGIEWSHTDLTAIMDELELMEECSDDDSKNEMEGYLHSAREVGSSLGPGRNSEGSDDEECAGGDRLLKKSSECIIDRCNSHCKEWYDYPYGHDFLRDFYCLKESGVDVREDLLNMLGVTEKSSESSSDCDEPSFNQALHDKVEDAIGDILVPGMSREGLKKLLNIVLREPAVNLKYHLQYADPYLLAYVIWGLNFYLSRHAKGEAPRCSPRIPRSKQSIVIDRQHHWFPLRKVEVPKDPKMTAEKLALLCIQHMRPGKDSNKMDAARCLRCATGQEGPEEGRAASSSQMCNQNSGLTNKIYSLGHMLLSWFCNLMKSVSIGPSYEDIIRPLAGCMRMHNQIEFIRQ